MIKDAYFLPIVKLQKLDLDGPLKLIFIMYNGSTPQLLLLNEKKRKILFSIVFSNL